MTSDHELTDLESAILKSMCRKEGGATIIDARSQEKSVDQLSYLGFIDNVHNNSRASKAGCLWTATKAGRDWILTNASNIIT